jgi:transposase
MLSITSAIRVFVYREVCDMRCSFEKLSGLTRNQIGQDPTSGHMFVFMNRTRKMIKVLYFDRTGYCIWYKKLESGTFSLPKSSEIDYRSFSCILEGIEEEKIIKKKRFLLKKSEKK